MRFSLVLFALFIASDNQDKIRYSDEPLNALGDIRVIGRIVWRGSRL